MDELPAKRRKLSVGSEDCKTKVNVLITRSTANESIERILNAASKSDLKTAVKSLRAAIYENRNQECYLNADLVAKLVDCIENSQLYSDAAWILTELAYQPTRLDVFNEAAVFALVKLLTDSQRVVSYEKVIYALCSLVRNNDKLRDLVVNCGAINPIVALIDQAKNVKETVEIVHCLLGICHHPPPPDRELEKIWPTLIKLLTVSDNELVISKVLLTLTEIMHGCDEARRALVAAGGLLRVIQLAKQFKAGEIPTLAVCCIYYVTFSCDLIPNVIRAKALSFLESLLSDSLTETTKQIILVLDAVSYGRTSYIACVAKAKFIQFLTQIFSNRTVDIYYRQASVAVKRVIGNLASKHATRKLVMALCEVLAEEHDLLSSDVLAVLENFIHSASTEDSEKPPERRGNKKRVVKFIKALGYDEITKLTGHKDKSISAKAVRILKSVDSRN